MAGNSRADDEARTRDLNLGKVALYQLSYVRFFTPVARQNEENHTQRCSTLQFQVRQAWRTGGPPSLRACERGSTAVSSTIPEPLRSASATTA